FLESHPEYAFVKGYSVGFGAEEYLWQKGFQHDFLNENPVDATALIRRSTHQSVGGYDATMRGGFEDWDFWLRCATAGYWGRTIPEYLDWYRRRPTHADRWADWGENNQKHFLDKAREKYPGLWDNGLPKIEPRWHLSNDPVPHEAPCENILRKNKPRLLMVMPWLTVGGADMVNLDLLKMLVTRHGYEVTIATTLNGDHSWMPLFGAWTPDIFPLHHFLRLTDYPRFLHYLIRSRQADTVLISNSYLCYLLLPYLRSKCPDVAFLDYLHMEEENWKNGGYPRASLNQSGQLDLTMVSTAHLKDWLVRRGGDAERIEVCTTNIDVNEWDPAKYDRAALRAELEIGAEMPVILYAGRLCAQKQPMVFAEAIRALTEREQEFTCLVAGDGIERKALEAFLQEHRLDSVRLLGNVSPGRFQELLALSDIFFLPSQMEGISLAIYEAMAMGVVPVAADVGGQRELVTPECGMLVRRDEHEVDSYVEALFRLLGNTGLRNQMRQSSRERVCDHFSLDQMSRRVVELVERAGQLARLSPRPVAPDGLAATIAAQVIEQTRLEWLADQLWAEREGLRARKLESAGISYRLSYRVWWKLRPKLQPAYRWMLAHGMGWLKPLYLQIRRAITL